MNLSKTTPFNTARCDPGRIKKSFCVDSAPTAKTFAFVQKKSNVTGSTSKVTPIPYQIKENLTPAETPVPFLISSYLIPGASETFSHLRELHMEHIDDIYILGISYHEGDTQFAITDKCHIGETYEECLARTLAKEAGVFCASKHYVRTTVVDSEDSHIETFAIAAENCVPFHLIDHANAFNFDRLSARDNKTKKCQIIVHGTYAAMMKLIKGIRGRLIGDNRKGEREIETIFGLTLVPLNCIR